MDTRSVLGLIALAAVVPLLAACGDGDSQAYAFQSLAHAPQGDPIRIVVAPKAGDGFDYRFSFKGSVSAKGEDIDLDQPFDASWVIHYLCEEVKEDGSVVMSTRMGEAGGTLGGSAVAPNPFAAIEGFEAKVEIGPDGRIRHMDLEGADESLRERIGQVFNQPGNTPFLFYPPEGLRIGEAIDYGKLFASDQMQALLGAAGGGLVPEIRGEAVLVRRLAVDGEDAAEFAVNLVMNLRGRVGEGKRQAEMDFGMKMSGRQYVAIATGFPLGTTTFDIEGRGLVSADDKEATMKFDFTVTCAAEKPAAPEAPVEPR